MRIFGNACQIRQQGGVKKRIVWCILEQIDVMQNQQGGNRVLPQRFDELAEIRSVFVF